MSDATERAKQAGTQVKDAVQNAGSQVKDAAQQAISDVRSSDAAQTLDNAKQRAAEIGAAATDKIDTAMDSTGDQLNTLAQKVRETAPATGTVGSIASTTADYLERGGQYLKENDVDQVRSSLETIIRQRPVESLLVGLGVGYLLARAFRR